MTTQTERMTAAAELGAVLAIEARDTGAQTWPPHMVARHVVELMRLTRRAERIALQQCNGIQRYDAKAGQVLASWTEQDEERAEKSRARIRKAIDEIGAHYAFKALQVGGDPRGMVVRIELRSGRKNGWGDGWGIVS